LCLGWLLGFPAAFALSAADAKLTTEQLDFFEKKIRPIFVDNCYKCHSHDSEKIKGGLLLDTRDGVLKGGDTGPAIVPGDIQKSLMLEAVRYTNKDLQMPPNDRQLEPEQIHDLETWVKMGAPDPRTGTNDSEHKYVVDWEKAKKHWSYQSVIRPAVPEPEDTEHWAQTPVDKFILATMLTKGLTPSPRTDRVTLIRRATFDLIGLPPTTKEVDDFLCDTSPDAFAKVVDRLLASPHYGERWGRHWLDVAHFADTRGAAGNARDERYPYSYTYRDYVIRAFNEDLPYDRFLMQQIAADKLPLGDDRSSLAALGFLTLGQRFNGQINDIIDDRIDIISKGTMAMTATCARCHDHKFDPILTQDYYALHGVFSSSIEPKEEPLLQTPKRTPSYLAFEREYEKRNGELKEFRDGLIKFYKADMIGNSAAYLLAIRDYHFNSNDLSRNTFLEKRKLNPIIGNIWDAYYKQWAKRHNPIFAPWLAFAQLDENEFAVKAKELSQKFYENQDKKARINPAIARLFADAPSSLGEVANRYQSVFKDIEERSQEMIAAAEAQRNDDTKAPPEPKLPDADRELIREMMYANFSPMFLDDQRLNQLLNRENKQRNQLRKLEQAISDLIVTDPGSPPRASVLEDADKPKNSYVYIKGNPGNRGPLVRRHFFTILSDGKPEPFEDGSGRLDLARDIASTNNPLTARVMVNRIWLYHFGEGLVRTPDDFGTRGDTPSHPELLDYLASKFMENGWSIKKLHRLIMLSSVYQQSSDENPRYEQIDPENRWLWRMNRRKLDFEALRDTILAIGGDLDMTMYGKPVKLDAEPYSMRRTIYGFVDRRNLPNMYAAFDFASPDLTTGKRESTVVPQQALFMMNNSLVVEQARNVVRRADFKSQAGPQAHVDMLYRLIYQRSPSEVEMNLALDYLRSDTTTEWQTNAQAAWDYGYGTYDANSGRTRLFVPMTKYAGNTWQPGGTNVDERLKGLGLTPGGGSPVKMFAVIRRWTAPRDGFISVDATLERDAKNGDGVEGRIVSSRSGELGSWVVAGKQMPTKLARVYVKRGETIDFVTQCRENPRNVNFKWAPVIKMERSREMAENAVLEWNARRDFSGDMRPRRLTSWEKFAQVLLETNELTFVN
jgi:hypothetical protein